MTIQAAGDSQLGLFSASEGAAQRWVDEQAARLRCSDQADRSCIVSTLKNAAARTAADWTVSFSARVSGFALWSGVVYASAIGAALWASRIPEIGSPAAATAAAYLAIVAVAIPSCRVQGRRVLEHLRRTSSRTPPAVLIQYLAIMLVSAIVYGVANISTFNLAADRHVSAGFYAGEFAAFVIVTAIGYVVAYLTLVYIYASTIKGPKAAGRALSWSALLAATAITSWALGANGSLPRPGNRRLDSGMLILAGCAARVNEFSRCGGLADSDAVRSTILALDLAAADIANYAIGRVPRFDTAIRRRARHDGSVLASVIQEAKTALACAVHPDDYAETAIALTHFILAWSRPGDRTIAKTADRDSRPALPPLWQRIVGRVWNAALLAAGGIGLPLLPLYHGEQAAAASLRYALLTAAILALASGGGTTSDIIQRNVEHTLPGDSGKSG